MKKLKIIVVAGSLFIVSAVTLTNCVSLKVTAKNGALLWGDNCKRCHNTPSPVDFTDELWETIGMHMQIRANLTDKETKKIVEFLQSAN